MRRHINQFSHVTGRHVSLRQPHVCFVIDCDDMDESKKIELTRFVSQQKQKIQRQNQKIHELTWTSETFVDLQDSRSFFFPF